MAGGVTSELALDVRGALSAVQQLHGAIDAATQARLTLDTTGVAAEITSAIDAANTGVVIDPDVAGIDDEITGAVDAADTAVVVTGDAGELTGEVTGAVDAADTGVEITGDASEVTGSITGAVDAADSAVVITADATDVSGSITGAVQAADTSVDVDVDESSLLAAGAASSALNTSLIATGTSGLRLRTILQLGAGGGAAAGLLAVANAASDVEESISKANQVFGDSIGTIEAFGATSAQSVGLSRQAAIEATATFGNLFTALGTTQEQAAELSPDVVQLAADLASFNNLAVDETLEKIRSGLVGEIEPLRSLGISFNAAQVEAKAMELGLADANGEVSEGAKLQARWALILEQSSTAQGDFARTSEGLANQSRIVRAEFQNAVATVGAALLPALLELVGVARTDLIPAFVEVATAAGPGLATIVTSLLPAFGSLASLIAAGAPAINLFAAALDAIPAPVLASIGLFLTLNKLVGLTGGLWQTAQRGVASFLTTLSPAGAILAAAAVGFALIADQQAKNRAEAAALAAQQDQLAGAFDGTEGAIQGVTDNLGDLVESGDRVLSTYRGVTAVTTDAATALGKAGLTTSEFAEALGDADQPLDTLIDRLGKGDFAARSAAETLDALATGYETSARQALIAGIATETYTQAQVDSALASTRNADGSKNYVAALDQISGAAAEAQAAEEAHAQALDAQGQALKDLESTAPAVTLTLEALATRGGDVARELVGFALAADQAGLSGTDLEAVAAKLGVTAPDLQEAIKGIAETVTGLRDAALGTLPSLQDIAGDFESFSVTGFRDELGKALEAVTNFNTNLATLSEQAGPRLAAAAAQLGPQYTQAFVDALQSGNPEVLGEIELLLAGVEQQGVNLGDLMTGTIGPNFAIATGQVGQLGKEAFEGQFTLDATGALVEVQTQITDGMPGVGAAAVALGEAGKTGFDGAFTPEAATGVSLVVTTIATGAAATAIAGQALGNAGKTAFEIAFAPNATGGVESARSQIDAGVPAFVVAGTQLGAAAANGLRAGLASAVTIAAQGAQAAAAATNTGHSTAYSSGSGIGANFGSGVAAGINSKLGEIQAAARAAVNAAAQAARALALISSPSRLFAEIGRDMGAGMAVGLDDSQAAIAAASASLVSTAADVAKVIPLSVAQPAFPVPTAGATAGAGAQVIEINVNVAAGAFPSITSPTEAAAAGSALAGSLAGALRPKMQTLARSA